MQTDSGEEVSSREVKKILEEAIRELKRSDFKDLFKDEISKQDNITFENQKVLEVEEFENHITVQTNSEIYIYDYFEEIKRQVDQSSVDLKLKDSHIRFSS